MTTSCSDVHRDTRVSTHSHIEDVLISHSLKSRRSNRFCRRGSRDMVPTQFQKPGCRWYFSTDLSFGFVQLPILGGLPLGPPRRARVGYMGHLFLMSTALQECKSQEAERGTEKSTLASWNVPHLDPCRIV